MTADLAVLVFAPFIAWHAYRTSHSVKTGVFKSLGSAVDRASMPVLFWFSVLRELLLVVLFTVFSVVVLLRLGDAPLDWLFGCYVAVYVSMLLVTMYRLRRQSNKPLERADSAERSAPGRASKSWMRTRCVLLFGVPIVAVYVTRLLESRRPESEQPGASLAATGFVALAIFLYVAPFVVQRLLQSSRDRVEALGIDVDQLVLTMGMAGPCTIALLAVGVTGRFGGSNIYPYAWSALAVLVSAFWCWRLRHVLR